MESETKFRAVITGIGFGKCLAKGTRVTMSDGTSKPIEKVSVGDCVLSQSEGEISISKVNSLHAVGNKKSFETKLQGGYSIVSSDEHKVLVADSFKRVRVDNGRKDNRVTTVDGVSWKKVKDLERMDLVAVPKNYERETNNQFSRKIFELTGYLIGDGCLRNKLSISIAEQEVVDRVRTLMPKGITLKHSYNIDYKLYSGARNKKGYCYNIMFDFYREVGLFNKGSHDKFIPKCFLNADDKHLYSLLSGLIVTDGWVDKIGIGYCTVSERLYDDVRLLLHNLGIAHTGSLRYVKYKGNKVGAYQISIVRVDDLKKIYNNCYLVHKHRKLKALLKKKYSFKTHKGINKLFDYKDLVFRRVLSVEEGESVEMFDLSIEKNHCYIANNIVVHNSAVGVVEMIRDCIEHPGVMNLIYAPTYPMLKNTTMVEFFKFCPKELIVKHNKSEHLIYLINGSTIIYLSGDNQRNIDRIRGLNLGAAYGDEIALSPSYVWKIIVGRLRDPRGSRRAWLTTTPKGFNWVYDWFVEKKHTTDPDEYEWFGGSSLDNPYTPQDYKDSLESTYSGAFYKQELLGEFVGYEGLVYSEFSRNVHVGDFSDKKFEEYVGGLDWGWTNPNVALLVGKDGDGRMYILKEVYVRRTHNEEFCGLVKNMIREKKDVVFQADPSEPAFINSFNNNNIITEGANNEILPGIQKVASLLKVQKDQLPRLFVDESCVNTIMEFENYRYPEVDEGKPERDLPIKVHDHAMDVIRYIAMADSKEVSFGFLEV